MGDSRSRREKLEAMANQTASPHEAAVARTKLGKHPTIVTANEKIDGKRMDPPEGWADAVWHAFTQAYTRQASRATYHQWGPIRAPVGIPCPGCGHSALEHVGGTCYACESMICNWVSLGPGNAYGLSPGWHNLKAT